MSNKAKKTGGLYSNRNDYFQKGKSPSLDADKQNYAGELQDGYSYVAHQDSPDPVAFTQSKTSRKGGGFDYGEKKYIYKKVEPKNAPVQQAPAPEPERSIDPIEHNDPEVSINPIEHPGAERSIDPVEYKRGQAKERVSAYKMDGGAGSQFSTDEPQAAAAAAAGTDAQDFADKYKLNLLNKGGGQPDFSGV